MIYESVNARELVIDKRELSARLGAPCEPGNVGIERAYQRLVAVASPAYVAVRVKINRENDALCIGGIQTYSRALVKVCESCDECFLLCATLGVGVDRLVMKTATVSAKDAFEIDAVADAFIEALCDLAEKKISHGLDTRTRFSPGYADLELSFGEGIISLTDAQRFLGIRLTATGLMVPKKSVSAIIGITGRRGE